MGQVLDRIRSLIASSKGWSLPVKFLIGALLSAVGGGGFFGFLLEHATYAYALTFGFRPPVEGLPYLRALVSFASVAVLLIAVIISSLFIGGFWWLLRHERDDDPGPNSLTRFRAMPLWKVALPSAAIAGVITATFVGYYKLTGSSSSWSSSWPPCVWPLIFCEPEPEFTLGYFGYAIAAFVVMILILWRPSLVWWSTAAAIFVYYSWIGANVLPPEGYARLLRSTGFGGGIHVTAELRSETDETKSVEVSGYMLLRTASYLIMYTEELNRIDEYPLFRVLRVSHPQGGLSRLPYKLPKRTALLESN